MRSTVVALLIVLAACGGSSEETMTTTTTTLTGTAEAYLAAFHASGVGEVGDADAIVLGESICRSLRLFEAAGTLAPNAADALRAVDLSGMTSSEMAVYGAALAAAPQTLCPDTRSYAVDVAYWLGI